MVSRKTVAMFGCGALGVVFLVVGCILIHVFSELIHSEVEDNIPLKEGSESYKNWQAPESPIYFQVWMYDVVNYLEVMQGEKPDLVQMGPYTYREHREKFNITYFNNGTLSYREKRTYVFEREMSEGTENDTFHCVNLPMLTIANMVKREPTWFKDIVDAVLKMTGESLFTSLSVGDLLWGYEDNFLKDVNKVAKDMGFHFSVPDKFGLFYNQNGSDDGVYEIDSGLSGLDNFGKIMSWNGKPTLSYWTSDLANSINGTDGTMYAPFINTTDTKYLFSSDLCRSLGMDYTESVTVRGIELKRFVAPEILFGNVSINPYNAGFCTPAGDCLPSGLLNVSECRQGAPVVMSMPHFLGCDDDIVHSVRGLRPNKDEHESFLEIEPMTGVVMNVGKKLQINTYIERIDGFSETYKIKPVYMPVMWLNESALISEKQAGDFRKAVLDKIKITDAIKYGLIAVGAFIMACVLIILIKEKLFPSLMRPKPPTFDNEESPIINSNGAVST